MRKIILATLIVLMTFLTMGCDKNAKEGNQKSLYEHGIDVIQLMSEMAHSTDYSITYTGNESIRDIINDIGKSDYQEVKKVYSISFDKDTLENMIEPAGIGGISDELKEYTMQRMITAFVSQINAYSGAETLAATTVCTAGKTFVSDELDQDSILIYTFEDAYPAAVTFIAGEDNTVSANGVFIVNDNFVCDSSEDIQNFFNENGISVNVVEYK